MYHNLPHNVSCECIPYDPDNELFQLPFISVIDCYAGEPVYVIKDEKLNILAIADNPERAACDYWYYLLNKAAIILHDLDSPVARDILNRLSGARR